ncbi:MAG: DUF5063 domain-containing protein [Micrococcales bacterium]|nr:MAG: DUF5063 domain-containing protein [Micrococcales bacterium]
MHPDAESAVLAAEVAVEAQKYLDTVTEVAAGEHESAEISLLLLAASRILAVGARLGASRDFLPSEQYEPDSGPDDDLGPLLVSLSQELDGLDEYADLVDPLTSPELTSGSLTGDLLSIAEDLAKGLQHARANRFDEALWWWQFSYLSNWGERAAATVRILTSVLSHLRLDADPDTLADAEFHALHP